MELLEESASNNARGITEDTQEINEDRSEIEIGLRDVQQYINDQLDALERTPDNFRQAIMDQTLIGYLVAQDKATWLAEHPLSDYEASLIKDGRTPKIRLLIDIDGVLIDPQETIRQMVNILTRDAHIASNLKAARDVIKNSKIPLSILLALFRARDQADEVCLITDRAGFGPCYFPCLGKQTRQSFEEHGIQVRPNAYKLLRSGQEFVSQIGESDVTYYIGSSGSDRVYVDRIRQAMTNHESDKSKAPIPNEKLIYLEIMPPPGREKNIL